MTEHLGGALPDIRLSMIMNAPIKKAWQAIATLEGLAQWLMPNNFQPILGHEFNFRGQPKGDFDGIVYCKVIELEPPNRLAFTWAGNNAGNMLHQHIYIELKDLDGQTEFTLVHAGWSEGYEILRDIMEDGWGYLTRGLGEKLGEE